MNTAIINELAIMRLDLLTKPLPTEQYDRAVQSYIEYFELMTGEHVYSLECCQWWLAEWGGIY